MAKMMESTGADGALLPAKDFRPFFDLPAGPVVWSEPWKRACMTRAQTYLTQEIPPLPATLYAEFSRTGNRANYEAPYFERRKMAFFLALAEHFEGRGRFTDKLMDTVWAILEETTWIIPAHNAGFLSSQYKETVTDIDLFSAETGACLAWVRYFAKNSLDQISPVICERIQFEVDRRLLVPFTTRTFGWATTFINNWVPWIVSNILTAAALTLGNDKRRKQIVGRSLAILDVFIDTYGADGGCNEGPTYWSAATGSLFDALEILQDMTGGRVALFSHPLLRSMCEYIMKMHIHDHYYVSFADGHGTVFQEYGMIARMGKKTGSRLLEEFGLAQAEREEADYLRLMETEYFRDTFPGFHLYRILREGMPRPESKPGFEHPLFAWLGDIQVMTCRQYAESGRGLFLAMKGGHNDESHSHNDVGNIIVYAGGRPLFLDTGSGEYTAKTFGPDRYGIWTMQSSYHNLPEIGGFSQLNSGECKASQVICDENARTLQMDLSKAYDARAEIIEWTRQASLDENCVRIADRFRLQQESEIRLHYITLLPPIFADGEMRFEGGVTAAFDPSLASSVEEIPLDEALNRRWNTDRMYRIVLTGRAKEGRYTLTIRQPPLLSQPSLRSHTG